VIWDLSVRVAGHWSACTNTLVVGAEPSAEQHRYVRAARRESEATVEALRPGTLTGEAVAAARRVCLSEGFDCTPSCGHQIDAAVNERPQLVIYDRTPVQAGVVFAVEPGTYGGEELGVGAWAVRVVVVRESGNEILSAFR
jgi:Xaa-Pro aminopeptidase